MPLPIVMISIAAFFVGQWLVTKKCGSGFLVWAVSNLLIAGSAVATGDWATTCLFITYFSANTCSLIAWAAHPA